MSLTVVPPKERISNPECLKFGSNVLLISVTKDSTFAGSEMGEVWITHVGRTKISFERGQFLVFFLQNWCSRKVFKYYIEKPHKEKRQKNTKSEKHEISL